MSTPLIQRYGGWPGVCQYFADQIGLLYYPELDKADFIAWMLKQEKYSDYEEMFGDMQLYLHAYRINQKLRSGEEQHHMTLISGKIGKGKSRLGLILCALADPTFAMNRICFIPPHLFKHLSKCTPGSGVLIDEGGRFFKGKNAMTGVGRDVSVAFQEIRALQQFMVVCYDEPERITGDIIEKFDSILIKIPDQKEEGNRRYRSYFGYNAMDSSEVMMLLKQKLAINSSKVLDCHTWKGHNMGDVPLINDISEKAYIEEKQRFLQNRMEGLYDKYAEEYGLDGKKEEAAADSATQAVKYISVSEGARMFGVSKETIMALIKSGAIRATRLGSKWLIIYEDLMKVVSKNANYAVAGANHINSEPGGAAGGLEED